MARLCLVTCSSSSEAIQPVMFDCKNKQRVETERNVSGFCPILSSNTETSLTRKPDL